MIGWWLGDLLLRMTRLPVNYVNTVLEVCVEVLKRVGVTDRFDYPKNSELLYN